MANVSTVTAGSITLGVAVGAPQFVADQLLAEVDVIRAVHERVPVGCVRTEFVFPRERLGVSRVSRILRVYCHAILQELKSFTRWDSDLSKKSSRVSRKTACMVQATLTAGWR